MFPSLYISHGSPMLALEPGASGPALARLAAELPKPKAIVIVSAHWESNELLVSGNPQPDTWHDFGGFPKALFEVQYPAPGRSTIGGRGCRAVENRGSAGAHRRRSTVRPWRLGAAVVDVSAGRYPGGASLAAHPWRPGPANPRRSCTGQPARTRRAVDRLRQHHPQLARTGLACRPGKRRTVGQGVSRLDDRKTRGERRSRVARLSSASTERGAQPSER